MARYRRYKNGIFGHRYKGYFIVKNETDGKKEFAIVSPDKDVLDKNISAYDDAEWKIDKMTATPELQQILRDLYDEELYVLSNFFEMLMRKDNDEGLSRDERDFYHWVTKIRNRKAVGKQY